VTRTLEEQEAKGVVVDPRLKTVEEFWETENQYVSDLNVMVNVSV
jgi:hypothetical protein